MTFEEEVRAQTDALAEMLIMKNRAYGDSALNPVRVFSKASPREQILVRLDDKLSRISRGEPGAFNEDVVKDIIGYLILLRVLDARGLKASCQSGLVQDVGGTPT